MLWNIAGRNSFMVLTVVSLEHRFDQAKSRVVIYLSLRAFDAVNVVIGELATVSAISWLPQDYLFGSLADIDDALRAYTKVHIKPT